MYLPIIRKRRIGKTQKHFFFCVLPILRFRIIGQQQKLAFADSTKVYDKKCKQNFFTDYTVIVGSANSTKLNYIIGPIIQHADYLPHIHLIGNSSLLDTP